MPKHLRKKKRRMLLVHVSIWLRDTPPSDQSLVLSSGSFHIGEDDGSTSPPCGASVDISVHSQYSRWVDMLPTEIGTRRDGAVQRQREREEILTVRDGPVVARWWHLGFFEEQWSHFHFWQRDGAWGWGGGGGQKERWGKSGDHRELLRTVLGEVTIINFFICFTQNSIKGSFQMRCKMMSQKCQTRVFGFSDSIYSRKKAASFASCV